MFRRKDVHCRERAVRQLTIRSAREDHVHMVELIGELDMDSTPAFEDELKRVEATDADEIIVDLTRLKSIDAVGVKAFIQADSRSRNNGDRLVLLAGSGQVRRIFETTGLATRLPFADFVR